MMLTREELEQWGDLERRVVIGGNDGADIYEAEEFARHLCEKYQTDYAGLHPMLPPTWEFPCFNKDGAWGPHPIVGAWTADGLMLGCREMRKDEQLRELFEATASPWRQFRIWLYRVNLEEFKWLEEWTSNWKH